MSDTADPIDADPGVEPASDHENQSDNGHDGGMGGYDYEDVLAIQIDATDTLQPDLRVRHPMVRFHLIDSSTGRYLLKSDPERAVVYPSEESTRITTGGQGLFKSEPVSTLDPKKVEIILPLLTRPCDFKGTRTYAAKWRERFIIDEAYEYLMRIGNHTTLLCELVDFGIMTGGDNAKMLLEDAKAVSQAGKPGWFSVAWAFLKFFDNQGRPNIGSPARLQFYRYYQEPKPNPDPPHPNYPPEVYGSFSRFQKGRYRTYPATLYVTVHSCPRPAAKEVVRRPLFPMEREKGRITYESLRKRGALGLATGDDDAEGGGDGGGRTGAGGTMGGMGGEGMAGILQWNRMPGQRSRVPNAVRFTVDAGPKGCFAIRFSTKGDQLAAACSTRTVIFAVKTFDVFTGRLIHTYQGHHELVYELDWSPEDRLLASCSSDGSVNLWPTSSRDQSLALTQALGPDTLGTIGMGVSDAVSAVSGTGPMPPLLTLQHTSFVYCIAFHPKMTDPPLLATGAYDKSVTIWRCDTGEVLQTLKGHKSNVNALVFDASGDTLYSGDGKGVIIQWSSQPVAGKSDNAATAAMRRAQAALNNTPGSIPTYSMAKKIKEEELDGSAINCLRMHPKARRLLIHSRHNMLRTMDYRTYTLLHRYSGLINYRYPVKSGFSSDGLYVVSGSEDGKAYIWMTETGELLRSIPLGFADPLCDVQWHPHDDIVAFAAFGESIGNQHTPSLVVHHYDKALDVDNEAYRETEKRVEEKEATGAIGGDRKADRAEKKRQRAMQSRVNKLLTNANLSTGPITLPGSAGGGGLERESASLSALGGASPRQSKVDGKPVGALASRRRERYQRRAARGSSGLQPTSAAGYKDGEAVPLLDMGSTMPSGAGLRSRAGRLAEEPPSSEDEPDRGSLATRESDMVSDRVSKLLAKRSAFTTLGVGAKEKTLHSPMAKSKLGVGKMAIAASAIEVGADQVFEDTLGSRPRRDSTLSDLAVDKDEEAKPESPPPTESAPAPAPEPTVSDARKRARERLAAMRAEREKAQAETMAMLTGTAYPEDGKGAGEGAPAPAAAGESLQEKRRKAREARRKQVFVTRDLLKDAVPEEDKQAAQATAEAEAVPGAGVGLPPLSRTARRQQRRTRPARTGLPPLTMPPKEQTPEPETHESDESGEEELLPTPRSEQEPPAQPAADDMVVEEIPEDQSAEAAPPKDRKRRGRRSREERKAAAEASAEEEAAKAKAEAEEAERVRGQEEEVEKERLAAEATATSVVESTVVEDLGEAEVEETEEERRRRKKRERKERKRQERESAASSQLAVEAITSGTDEGFSSALEDEGLSDAGPAGETKEERRARKKRERKERKRREREAEAEAAAVADEAITSGTDEGLSALEDVEDGGLSDAGPAGETEEERRARKKRERKERKRREREAEAEAAAVADEAITSGTDEGLSALEDVEDGGLSDAGPAGETEEERRARKKRERKERKRREREAEAEAAAVADEAAAQQLQEEEQEKQRLADAAEAERMQMEEQQQAALAEAEAAAEEEAATAAQAEEEERRRKKRERKERKRREAEAAAAAAEEAETLRLQEQEEQEQQRLAEEEAEAERVRVEEGQRAAEAAAAAETAAAEEEEEERRRKKRERKERKRREAEAAAAAAAEAEEQQRQAEEAEALRPQEQEEQEQQRLAEEAEAERLRLEAEQQSAPADDVPSEETEEERRARKKRERKEKKRREREAAEALALEQALTSGTDGDGEVEAILVVDDAVAEELPQMDETEEERKARKKRERKERKRREREAAEALALEQAMTSGTDGEMGDVSAADEIPGAEMAAGVAEELPPMDETEDERKARKKRERKERKRRERQEEEAAAMAAGEGDDLGELSESFLSVDSETETPVETEEERKARKKRERKERRRKEKNAFAMAEADVDVVQDSADPSAAPAMEEAPAGVQPTSWAAAVPDIAVQPPTADFEGMDPDEAAALQKEMERQEKRHRKSKSKHRHSHRSSEVESGGESQPESGGEGYLTPDSAAEESPNRKHRHRHRSSSKHRHRSRSRSRDPPAADPMTVEDLG